MFKDFILFREIEGYCVAGLLRKRRKFFLPDSKCGYLCNSHKLTNHSCIIKNIK